jgi:release factor glutamine methyltransferase
VTVTDAPVAAIVHRAARSLAAISDDARLEAEVLLAYALGVGRSRLLALGDSAPDAIARARFEALLRRRLAREPLAYITGSREFYGVDLACTPAALIPRPETELLVDIALEELRRRPPARVVDVGTGSGAIAIALALNAPGASITAIDASTASIALAARNATRHGVEDRIAFVATHLLDGIREADVMVANLPYVSESDWRALPPEIRAHEPREALVGGATGTEAIERLLASAPAHLAPGGVLAAEIGAAQGGALVAAARARFPDAGVCVKKDLAGLDRVVLIRR